MNALFGRGDGDGSVERMMNELDINGDGKVGSALTVVSATHNVFNRNIFKIESVIAGHFESLMRHRDEPRMTRCCIYATDCKTMVVQLTSVSAREGIR